MGTQSYYTVQCYPRPQDSESTASRLICEVNQSAAQLVPRWGTTRESQVLWFCYFLLLYLTPPFKCVLTSHLPSFKYVLTSHFTFVQPCYFQSFTFVQPCYYQSFTFVQPCSYQSFTFVQMCSQYSFDIIQMYVLMINLTSLLVNTDRSFPYLTACY